MAVGKSKNIYSVSSKLLQNKYVIGLYFYFMENGYLPNFIKPLKNIQK